MLSEVREPFYSRSTKVKLQWHSPVTVKQLFRRRNLSMEYRDSPQRGLNPLNLKIFEVDE